MKKQRIKYYFLIGLTLAIIVYSGSNIYATNYYVSNSGNDLNTGRYTTQAWRTLTKVNHWPFFKPGDQILFKRGDLWKGTITVKASGVVGGSITYGAYGTGVNPVVTGFTSVSSWTNKGGNIWESTSAVSTLPSCNIVVINGVNTPMGREPELGSYYTVDSHLGNASITSSDLTGTPDWTGSETVIRKERWIWQNAVITSQSTSTINYTDVYSNEWSPKVGWGFFIQNHVSTLDTQNEWHYNPSTKKISVYSTTEPTNVKVASSEYLVNISNKDYITINDINFEGSNTAAIYNYYSDNVTVKNCEIENSGNDAIYSLYSDRFTSESNQIKNSNYHAIYNSPDVNGTITNNTIDSTAMIVGIGKKYAPAAITLSSGLAQYNTITNSGYHGMLISASSNKTLVKNNFVNNSLLNRSDGGGIYTAGTFTDCTIDGNIVLNTLGYTAATNASASLTCGIYLDYPTVNVTVSNNSVVGSDETGILNSSGHDNTISGNTTFDNHSGLNISDWRIGSDCYNLTVIDNIFVAKTVTQLAAAFYSWSNNIPSYFTTSNNNYFVRPIDNDNYIYIGQPDQYRGGLAYKNLSEWQAFSRLDSNSYATEVEVASEDDFLFEYNATKSPKTVSFSQPMIDVKGNKYATSITLQPYTSVVLMKDPNPAVDISICEGSSYEGWTTSGQYQRVLTTASGADSIVYTNLTVNPVYRVSEEITILEGEIYERLTTSGQYERTFNTLIGCDSIITTTLFVKPFQIQSIALTKGWNIFSSYLVPANLNMEHLLKNLQSQNKLIEIHDEAGKTYQENDREWTNNIGKIEVSEGYKIKIHTSCVLVITGHPIQLPVNIQLHEGWNIISFPYNGNVDAMEVIQPLIDAGILEKVQDEMGNSIESWGSLIGWVNEIGDFNVDEGYLVKVNQNSELPILEVYKKSGLVQSDESELTHFNTIFEGNGFGHMNINIIGLNESDIQVGDELAAFDGEKCVGAVKVNEIHMNTNIISIQASNSDEDIINGFKEGNRIDLRVWQPNTIHEFQPQVEIIKGNRIYQKHGSIFFQLLEKKNTKTNEFKIKQFDIYPNPASNGVTLIFSSLPEKGSMIILTDITGKLLMKQEVNSLFENLDISTQPSGIYLIKILSENNYKMKKLIIN